METLPVRGETPDEAVVARAVDALRRGELLIYPTDTLYALGGRAGEPGVGQRVRAAKGREAGKALPLVAADAAQARGLAAGWPPAAERLAARFWPGPLTLVLLAAPGVPAEVTAGGGTVAVRVPGLALPRELCRETGPLVSTSANRSGGPAPLTCAEAVAAVGEAAGLALDAGPGRPQGSTIVDVATQPPRLLRAGAIPWRDVQAVLLSGAPC
ncbi:MAG: threonylcarbamoyl-AMP synthase [Acidobacteria bacterium]|nr:threonylcarbamoyl-AMP synthase [Acidobacteriota bacterium]